MTLAEAELFNRGGGLIYCDTLNITLLQNANYGAGSIYDDGSNTKDGKMTWDNAMDWAEDLSYYDSVRGITYNDWRLPSALNPAGIGPDLGYNVTGSEMGYIYYIELGNLGYEATDGSSPQPGWGLTNTGPFFNLQSGGFWSRSVYTDFLAGRAAWTFAFGNGAHVPEDKNFTHYAWAVRPGDVADTEPELPGCFISLLDFRYSRN